MSVLKSNFDLKKDVKLEEKEEKTLEERFEKAAMSRIGGSIAFVSKKKVSWDSKKD